MSPRDGREKRSFLGRLGLLLAATVLAPILAIAILRGPDILGAGEPFDHANPPEALQLCRLYGRSAIHASPLPNAPVLVAESGQPLYMAARTIDDPRCPFAFEVRVAPDRYVQYTGRGGP